MKPYIRIAKSDDCKAITELLIELFTLDIEFEPNYEVQYNGVQQIIESPAYGEILVITINNKIIGSVALLYSISTALGGKVATIEDMIISKEYRNLGYGKLLFNEALEFSKSRNCLRATLLTDFNNENAIRFYKKFGFFTSQMIPLRIIL